MSDTEPSEEVSSTQSRSVTPLILEPEERLTRRDSQTELHSPSKRHFALSPHRLITSISRRTSPHKPRSKSVSRVVTPKLSALPPHRLASLDKDKPSIEGISKSFVSFLTTASVYAGFEDLEGEEQQIAPEDVPTDEHSEDNEEFPNIDSDNVSDDEDDQTCLANSPSPLDLTINENTKPPAPHSPPRQIRKARSRFEFSVAKRLSEFDNNQLVQKRAIALSNKLKRTFDISDNDEFISDYPCWLIGDVLLQGHLYITKFDILFFAFLPKKQGSITKSGALTTKAYPSLREHRKWAVLRNNTFSVYANSTDLYFPLLVIDLRTALRAEILKKNSSSRDPSKPTWIRIITESRTHWFLADNLAAARSWTSSLTKHIFASKNKGDQVAIKIPLQNVVDLELTSVIGITKNLRIKVIESADTFAVDDYFLMFFSKGENAVEDIKKVIHEAGVEIAEGTGTDSDDEYGVNSHLLKSKIEILKQTPSMVKTSSKPSAPVLRIAESLNEDESEKGSDQSKVFSEDEIVPDEEGPAADQDTARESAETAETAEKDGTEKISRSTSRRNWSTRSLVQGITAFTHHWISTSPITHYDEKCAILRGEEDTHFVKDQEQRQAATERFRSRFSLADTEKLISTYHAYLVKGIPSYGKIYLGSNEMCFRSTIPGTGTIMILPFTDIENIMKEKGFRFGYSGLVIVIHGHEELFFEFASDQARDDCEFLLLKQIDMFKKGSTDSAATNAGENSSDESCKLAESNTSLASARLRMFENRMHDEIGIDVPIIIEEHPLRKTNLRPLKSYRFTLLTIGSRGDVQPYISLGKALMREGHQVRIVTHSEFEPWIKKHGISFAAIAGDPSELMALMVTHPTINYNFIKEAKSKFRSWIDDLLVTSWNSCQDTDVLIESPSSICGIHIAERLKIPYFRAFTMPWTRTRAYPHAFMVPDQKLGGAYNYMTYVAFENGYWRGTVHQINKWRVETLGLPKTTLAEVKANNVPFLYNISPTVFPPPVDFSEWVQVTGYWFLDESDRYEPPGALLAFIEQARHDDKKLVYIGFGSIVVSNPAELTQAVVDAVLEADVRCILNKGWSDRLGSKSEVEIVLPPEIYNAGNVPHDWLFPKIDAAVHHGGSGTTGASLRFGLPTIIKPFFGDQKFYAGRVEDLGCGIALKDLDYKSLAKALKEATTSTRIVEKAKLVGEKIRSENGVQTAIDTIYREMEYARSISVSKTRHAVPVKSDEEEEDQEVEGSWLLV
ncbi:hypothetical protein OGAPHI_002421 [Ogataea philodendri]|uniref:Sterol 3-beta-glucosyltransferase n=1 Tax=Ogataea philodendri TaxID=1378263 RepID=A0A9P8PCB4_9ASCO|nr:uncharacterized protein OGAPHI_002421 [Ogataea philodendri]KAH3668667.1 hypothetical protein OGAPHI_002421 [Ogataea philodendri]